MAVPKFDLQEISHLWTVEWGILMAGGGYEIRNPSPEVERVYPVAEWLEHQTKNGLHVYRRVIIPVRPWKKATAT